MWFQLSLLLLFGAALADHNSNHKYAWNSRQQYQYFVQSRTLTSLHNDKNVTGIQFKGILTVQADSSDTLTAKLTNPQYARVNTELSQGWETLIPDAMLQYRKFPLSESPFQIKLKQGVIQELLFEQHVSNWEVNLLKSIVSQLQIDTQGKNLLMDEETVLPGHDERPVGTYKVMEDSVGGKCEVLYDVKLLENDQDQNITQFEPMLNSNDQQQFIEIKKLKNYNKCEQQKDYSHGFNEANLKLNDDDVMKFSGGLMVIYGNLKRFTIFSSVMRNNIYIKSENKNLGTVHSQVVLTLKKVDKHYSQLNYDKLKSAGNLVYIDDSSFLFEKQGTQSSSEEDQFNEQNSAPSSSFKNSKEIVYYPYSLKLSDVPDSPIMPFFKNQNVELSKPINAARQHIEEIVNEMEQPNDLPFHETLEKYTILVNMLRVFNVDQYCELKKYLEVSPFWQKSSNLDEYNFSKINRWDIFYDAVVQSGTEPALLVLADWLKNEKDFSNLQLLQIISQIPYTARTLTPEYVKVFFNSISHPSITRRNYVNRLAPVAFSQLVYNTRATLSRSGKLTLDQDTDKIYISYLEKELNQAVKNNNNALIETYITALGNLGNWKVLSIFEPYLEGHKSVTKHERMLMVKSLGRLIESNPKVKNVFYKIYLNEQEAPEVRCMAVFLYLLSNPSLTALKRMAKFTNYDKSEQVNSAVKSGIISLSKVNRPDLHQLVENARIARKLLTPKSYDFRYSKIYFTHKSIAVSIGSEDSNIPKFASFDINNFYNSHTSSKEIQYTLSGAEKLSQVFQQQEYKDSREHKTLVEKLVEQFNIKLGESEKFEGHVALITKYKKIYFPFQEEDLVALARWIFLRKSEMNFNHLYLTDKVRSFSTESGLLFSYSEQQPILIKVDVSKNLDVQTDISIKLRGNVNAVLSGKVQRRFGFSVPFEHQQYQTGIDTKWQMYLPVEYKQQITLGKEPNYELRLRPISQNTRIKLLHYNTVSFNTRFANFDFRPLSSVNTTNIIDLLNQRSLSYRMGTIYVNAETNAKSLQQTKLLDLASQIKDMFNNPNSLSYNKFEVLLDNEEETNNVLRFNINYEQQNNDNDQNNLQLKPETWLKDIKDVTDKSANSKERRKQVLQEVSKDIKYAKAHVYDVSLEVPSLLPRDRLVCTVGLGRSHVDPKSRFLLYLNLQSRDNEKIQTEALVSADVQSVANSYQNFNDAMKQTPMNEFMIDMLIGDKNKITDKIQIEGNFTQSDSLRKMIMNSKISQRCRQQIEQNNNELSECQEVIQNAQMKDNLKLWINMDSERYNRYTDMALKYLSDIMPSENVKLANPKNTDKNTVDLEMKISPNYQNARILMNTPRMNVAFNIPASFENLRSLPFEEMSSVNLLSRCMVERPRVHTFDGKVYNNSNLEEDWQIMMLPAMETRIPENMKAAVKVRSKDNRVQVSVMLDNQQIVLKTLNNGTFVMSTSENCTNIEVMFPPKTIYLVHDNKSQLIAEIIDTAQNTLWMMAPKQELFVSYDKERVAIHLPDRYRSKIRGLCGNYDKQASNDLLTPENCIMQDSNIFTAMYTLTDDNNDSDQKDILNKKWTTNNFNCVKANYRQTDVVSDEEAGRLTGESLWGHHLNKNLDKNLNNENAQENLQKNIINRTKVEEDDEQICFSLEPVPTCRENSEPMKTKWKEISFHCMPRNEIARELKHRIQQGANPNMSHKSVTMKQNHLVPIACKTIN